MRACPERLTGGKESNGNLLFVGEPGHKGQRSLPHVTHNHKLTTGPGPSSAGNEAFRKDGAVDAGGTVEMISGKLTRIGLERWLPILGTAVFLILIAVAEYQVRTSPQWPPPARHAIGAWEIPDPPAWTLAGSVNLPATVPIVAFAALSDSFTYAMDDHELVVYIPWTILVFYLWYFVALHVELWSSGWIDTCPTRRRLFFVSQLVLTLELMVCALGLAGESSPQHQKIPAVVLVFLLIWSAGTLLGWANLILDIRQKGRRGISDPY